MGSQGPRHRAGTFFAAAYRIFITGFGDLAKLNEVPWEASVGLESLYLSTCGVQLFFAWTIYQIKKQDRVLPMVVVILALAAFGASVGTAQIGLMSKLELYSDLSPISPVTITQAVLTFACDLVITASLLLRLQEGKQQAETSESQLRFLVVTAINRGALIVCMALLNIILFLAKPGTFDFLSMVIISGNLYMNSMLAMLNSREHARVLAGFSTSIVSEEFRAGPASWVEDPEEQPIPSLHVPSRNTTRTQRSRGEDAEEGFDEEFDSGGPSRRRKGTASMDDRSVATTADLEHDAYVDHGPTQ
uniref:DUF6534 domain-containing protein n=1 Tax=Mycena chlorophos TaxID=658473 RepID=A0ABQ0LCY4_MYCCL|nr:predicted protein [Mycena chlorophos]